MSSVINIFDTKTGKYIEIPTLRGPIGQTGVSITDIKLDHSEGYVDYYKIYLSDGNFKEFTVTNGQGAGDMTMAKYDKNGDGIVDNAELVNGYSVNSNVPADAKFTDTIFELQPATNNKLGGVIIDTSTLTINENGLLSAIGTLTADRLEQIEEILP